MKLWPAVHRCPWPHCTAYVEPDLWGCKQHWYAIPPQLRRRLWESYRKGQTLATASDDYREAAAEVARWIESYLENGGTRQARPGNHGWVTPRPDGARAPCGGPRYCAGCQAEAREVAKQDQRQGDLPL